MEGIIRLHEAVQAGVPPAYEMRSVALVTDGWDAVPGLVSVKEAARRDDARRRAGALVEACTHLRDEEGFNFLSDISAADYLGWGDGGVSGLHRHGQRRPRPQHADDAGPPGAARAEAEALLDELPPALGLRDAAPRCACRPGSTTARPSPSVIEVWPTADWHEREAWDMMGIPIDGHPNLKRILMDDDWEGHPLRKDYPIGGEPVRFSEDE